MAQSDTIADVYRLSPVQEGMLFHSLHAEGGGAYLQQFAYAVSGDLDVPAFTRAFQETVDRHPALRTAFLWERAGRPLQVVARRAALAVTTERWDLQPEEAERRALAGLLDRDRERGLDLGKPPLTRLTLVEAGGAVRYLLWTYHHAVLDGWSMALVLGEVFARYRTLRGGAPFEREPPRPFRDYIAWLERQDLAAAEAYWRQTLAGLDGATALPAGDAAGPVEEEGEGKRTLILPAAATAALTARAQRSGLTLNTLAQGAWALLLGRASDASEVVFGGVVSGRPADLDGVETMVGMFINTLPVRVRLAGAQPVGEWLRELQAAQLAMRRFEYSPLSEVQTWSGLPAGKPLFESILVFENRSLFSAAAAPEADGAPRLQPVGFQGTTGYPLVAAVEPDGDSLALTLAYDRRRFDPLTLEHWLEHFAALLESLAGDPGRPVDSLSPLRPGERQQLLREWNDSHRDLSIECLHRRFSAQAARTPDAVALECAEAQLTYRELDRRSDRLAHFLRRLGVGPEVVAGILLRRSSERIIAVFGILKAGGAYLPLDPEQPSSRLAAILADSGAPFLLTRSGLSPEIAVPGLRAVRLDEAAAALAAQPDCEPAVGGGPEHLAYVIYTSGSTGRPKGVAVPHGEIDAMLAARQSDLPLAAGDRVLDTTSFGFDATLWSTFAPLAAGARLVLSLPEGGGESGDLGALVERHGITALQMPPAWLRIFLELWRPGMGAQIRSMVCGGESLRGELAERFFACLPAGLHNYYGPTETALDATAWTCRRDAVERVAPIGRPVPGKEIYLLDRALRPVALGEAGEIFIGGAGLARGYLGDPTTTALRFVPHPWSATPGGRLYRSGDRARFRRDGNLEFLGRVDHQVKIRGHRIELGEIEASLSRHPELSQAVVVTWEDPPGAAPRLVAYVVPRPGYAPGTSALRRFLEERLPEAMVPAVFVELPALPLTSRGKLDRAALPPPGADRPRLASSFVAPRDAREERLAEIWRGVLGVQQVGIHDNFFELGGDSILSLQIVARARKAGILLTTRQLFAHPTLAELSAAAPELRPAVQAEQGAVAGEVPATPIQRWFLATVKTDPQHWNQALLLAVRRPVVPAHLARAVRELLVHHDALRLRFVPTGEGVRQVHADPETAVRPAPFLHLDLAGLPEARWRGALAAAAAALQGSLDLVRGPLLRFALLAPGGAEPARLLVVVHHLVIDGVSWRPLLEDLATLLGQLGRGEAPRLPAKTTSFKAWAERLAEHARTPAVAAELDFWLASEAVEPLPRDRSLGRNVEATRRTVQVALSEAETRSLLRDLPRAYGTRIDDVLVTAVALAFRAWTGRPRLLLDLEGHGREDLFGDVDLTRTVGWFTAEYPVRLTLEEGSGAVPALRAVQEQLRRVPSRGIGYGLLRHLHPDPAVRERLLALPQAEVVFNYLGQFEGTRGGDDDPFSGAPESAGPPRSPRGERPYLFDLNGSVTGGRLLFDWSYSAELHDQATVSNLAGGFLAALRELLSHALASGEAAPAPADFPLARVDRPTLERLAADGRRIEDLYPLSPMQQGMLFDSLHREGGEEGAYVMQLAWTLSGEVDPAAFAAAWRRVVERHPVLRTAFVWEGCDEPLQMVLREAPPDIRVEDWRDLSAAEQERRLAEQSALRRRSFDLSRAPLVRLNLLRLSDRSWQFLWTSHHLILDGWSTPILFAEFAALYRAERRGTAAGLPERRPYRDYIAWLAERDPAVGERFFRRHLGGYAGAPPMAPLLLPEELRRPGESYAEVRRRLSPGQTAELRAFARRHRLTLSTVVHGAWALVVGRLQDSFDVVFGATVAGRPAALAGVDEMVGMFINTLPVRLRIDPGQVLVPWLAAHQERQAELGEHEHTPLSKVQQWCPLPPGTALFESILVFENYPDAPPLAAGDGDGEGFEMGGLRYAIRESFPLILDVGPGAELSLRLKYDAGLYAGDAGSDAMDDLGALLLRFAAAPEAPLGALLSELDARAEARLTERRRELQAARHERLQRATRRRG